PSRTAGRDFLRSKRRATATREGASRSAGSRATSRCRRRCAMPRKLSRRASRIWERLGQWYGSRLADAYGPTPPEDWAELIDRTDDERLEDALVSVRRESPVFPPTLGQLEAAIPKRQRASGQA